MAGTNPDSVIDDDKPVTEDDLRALKYPTEEVETAQVEDDTLEDDEAEEAEETSEEDGQTDDDASEEEASAEASFVKEFDYIKGDTPEEYAKNLEIAYANSTAEFQRLRAEAETSKVPPSTQVTETEESPPTKSVTDLYVQQRLDEDIKSAFTVIQTDYPQVNDPSEYQKFTEEVAVFANAAMAKGRLAPPADLYNKAAISLGWEKKTALPDDKDKLGMALKDGAATSKTTSGPAKPKPTGPKVSEAMLKLNRKMYPGKSDQEIIEELTPYL